MGASIPTIEANGTHRQVGQQIGEATRYIVARGLAGYEDRFPALAGISFAEAVDRARSYLKPAESYLPQSVDQIRGLAEGAGVPFEYVFALNCSEELTCQADRTWPRPEHCTSFAFSAGGRVVAGHNEDWYPDDIEALVVRRVRLAGGPTYLSVGAAWDLPMTGLSSHGFSAAANTLYYRDERVGMPNNCLTTAVLEAAGVDDAADLIAAAPRARGSNHLLAAGGGRILDIETTAIRMARIDGGALFAHANHYVSPELAAGDATGSEGTFARRARAERLLADGVANGADPVLLAQTVLRDHAGGPLSICAHLDDSDPALDQSVTTASMVWEPAAGQMQVAVGPPCEHEYVAYGL